MKRTFDFGLIDYEGRGKALNRVTVEMEYKNLKNKKRFSVCVNVWNGSRTDIIAGGHCLDSIAAYIDSPLYTEILRLWELYRLNDMHPECEHQRNLGWRKIASKKVTLYHWRMTNEALIEQKDIENYALSALRTCKIFTPTPKQAFIVGLSYFLTTYTDSVPTELAPWYEPKKPLYTGDEGHTEIKTLGRLRESEHPQGILSKACPVCGYKYGNAWNYVPIPAEDEKIIYKLLEEGSL